MQKETLKFLINNFNFYKWKKECQTWQLIKQNKIFIIKENFIKYFYFPNFNNFSQEIFML